MKNIIYKYDTLKEKAWMENTVAWILRTHYTSIVKLKGDIYRELKYFMYAPKKTQTKKQTHRHTDIYTPKNSNENSTQMIKDQLCSITRCSAVKCQNKQQISVMEMRMGHCSAGEMHNTRKDKTGSEHILDK